MKALFILCLFYLPLSVLAGINSHWLPSSDPLIMGKDFIYDFDKLPLKGDASDTNKFWSSSFWSIRRGNINLRWNSKSGYARSRRAPTSAGEAKTWTQEELSQLSPTEKYDLFTGRYNYPLRAEISAFIHRPAQRWEGICHGWSAAAINHPEPTPKLMVNPDGITIPFGSSDIKGLLSYYYGQTFKYDNSIVGHRCYPYSRTEGTGSKEEECRKDLNAGAWHIIIANKMGLRHEGFVGDRSQYLKVNNHPFYAYETKVLREQKPDSKAAPGTKRVLLVKTKVLMANETTNTWEPTNGTHWQRTITRWYTYTLELDDTNSIIGGDFIGGSHPDFIWLAPKALIWVGQFDRLNELLND